MERILITLFILTMLYGVFNTYKSKKTASKKTNQSCKICKREKKKIEEFKKELLRIKDTEYIKEYIVDVINNGSNSLNFKSSPMEGGFASKDDADKIASYVVSLSHPNYPFDKDAPMFYTSICGGCHGNDAKGLGGKFPDLTKKMLLGIAKKEEFLIQNIKNSQHHQ